MLFHAYLLRVPHLMWSRAQEAALFTLRARLLRHIVLHFSLRRMHPTTCVMLKASGLFMQQVQLVAANASSFSSRRKQTCAQHYSYR